MNESIRQALQILALMCGVIAVLMAFPGRGFRKPRIAPLLLGLVAIALSTSWLVTHAAPQ